jgi:hypothetical protein
VRDDLDEVRAQFRADRCRHVVLPALVDEERAAPMREGADAVGFAPFYEPDRGRYAINRDLVIPELFDELRELVGSIVERELTLGPVQWLRLVHRDYSLTKTAREVAGPHVEVTVDFSARTTAHGEIVYTDGVASWVVPQLAGSVAIVEREPWLYRYERYLDHRVGDGAVYRVRLAFL